jgi:hypothetical protein
LKLVNGMIEMEQCAWPGSVGDSMAETSRYAILTGAKLDQWKFRALGCYCRHQSVQALPGWDVSDTSNDQLLPFILATGITGAWNKIPCTKTIVSPGVYFAIRGMWKAFALTVKAQNLIFALPYRWSDSKKWFEKTVGSSADYLNYFVSIVFLRRMGIVVEPRPETMDKIKSYYEKEPNSSWLIEEYIKHLS